MDSSAEPKMQLTLTVSWSIVFLRSTAIVAWTSASVISEAVVPSIRGVCAWQNEKLSLQARQRCFIGQVGASIASASASVLSVEDPLRRKLYVHRNPYRPAFLQLYVIQLGKKAILGPGSAS